MTRTKTSNSLQKMVMREVYLLLLALLTFISFFVPAMIHSVTTPDAAKSQNRLWMQIVFSDDTAFRERPEIGSHIGVAMFDEDREMFDIFDRQDDSPKLSVAWSDPGFRVPIKINRTGDEKIPFNIWVSKMPRIDAAKSITSDSMGIRVVLYHERQSLLVVDAIRKQKLTTGDGVFVFELSPDNGYQSSVDSISSLLN